jgi:two-component system, sensor histidine kinase and response regulator
MSHAPGMPKGKDNARFKVLIVDDVPKNIQVAANILKTEGYQLFFAQDGEKALEQIEKQRFDLILLDVMMPRMDGYQVCQRIKKNPVPAISEIPVIFLTARSDVDDVVNGFSAGAVDYVTKPFNGTELLARVRTHLELRQSRQELKELNATKDKFFSIVAHDLRNPVQSVLLLSEMLNSKYDRFGDQKRKDYIRRISRASEQLSIFLESLLHWSKSQRQAIRLNPRPITLEKTVAECFQLLEDIAEKKDIAMESLLTDGTMAYGDEEMIKTVIRNLLSNALKFTPPGGKITVGADENEDTVGLWVRDTGVGIQESDKERLFRLDVQFTTPGTAKEKGSGLGLLLCKELVEKNNGSISVTSRPGGGSRFTVTLPVPQEKTPHGEVL